MQATATVAVLLSVRENESVLPFRAALFQTLFGSSFVRFRQRRSILTTEDKKAVLSQGNRAMP